MAPTSNSRDWSERLGTAVRDAAPEVPEFTTGEQLALWQQINATTPTPTVRRGRWKTAAAGMVAVVAIGGAGAATASVLSAHTGQGPVDADDAELGGPGERLNPGASDFAAVVEEATTDIRFPSAQSRDQALSWETEDLSSDEDPASVSTGALRLWTAGHALCSWSNTWAVALRTGDEATENRAAAVILSAGGWRSITDTDPDQADESEFAWLPDLERAVRRDDRSAAKDALDDHGACMPGLAPELGLGKRW